MVKSTLLDWQKDSLLLARGEALAADRLSVDGISIQPLDGDAAESLKRAAVALSVKGDVSVLVARELVEMRTLSIPKMDADELPDIIRFQAQRQFANMTEAWPVDFVLLPQSTEQEMQMALVAALPSALLGEIESACSAAGLDVKRVLLRPLEVARMAISSGHVSYYGPSLVICIADAMADLLVLHDGQVVQIRSTRLPQEADLRVKALQAEVKRSLAASAAELGGGKIETVLLVATQKAGNQLAEPLHSALNAKIVRVHPEEVLAGRLKQDTDEQATESIATRLAGIGGALQLSTADKRTVIDFKHPRKRPPKQRNTRKWVLIGTAAAAIPLLFLTWYLSRIRSLNNEYEGYRSQIETLKQVGESARTKVAEWQAIENFLKSSQNWLDELTYIAGKMPPANKVKLESPTFSIGREGEGVIIVEVKAADSKSIADFERSLRDANHNVSGSGAIQLAEPEGDYKWKSKATIRIIYRGWNIDEPQEPNLSGEGAKPRADANAVSQVSRKNSATHFQSSGEKS